MKRLAVLLVGEYRTWAMAHPVIFKFFEDKAETVDYYFVTWDKNGDQDITEHDIVSYFQNKNLVNFKIMPVMPDVHTYYKQAKLAKIANILKRQYEKQHNFLYDQVVETRPDVYLRSHGLPWNMCGDFQYSACYIEERYKGEPFMVDAYYRTNSLTNDVLSNRFFNIPSSVNYAANLVSGASFVSHHWYITKYLLEHTLIPREPNTYRTDYAYLNVIRPNFPADIDLLNLSDQQVTDLWTEWADTTKKPSQFQVTGLL